MRLAHAHEQTVLWLQGVKTSSKQEYRRSRRVVDDNMQKLLLAFAAAPALVDLRVHLPDRMSMSSTSLVSDEVSAFKAPLTTQLTCTPATKHCIGEGDVVSAHTSLEAC